MATPGTKPKPTNLHILNGNPSKKNLNVREPKPRPITPACPEWMDDIGRAEWARIVPELEALGLITCVDGAALEGYCKAYSRWIAAELKLDALKTTVFKPSAESNYLQVLPYVTIAQKYLGICKGFMVEFGLTPSARARMALPTKGDAGEGMAQLLDGGR